MLTWSKFTFEKLISIANLSGIILAFSLCVVTQAFAGLGKSGDKNPGPTPVVDQSAIDQAVEITNLVENTLDKMSTQIQNQITELSKLSNGSFEQANGSLNDSMNQINQVLSSVQNIQYDLTSIDDQFNQLFPSYANNPHNKYLNDVMINDYKDYLKKWDDQLQNASNTAMQSQTAINNIQNNTQAVQAILSQSSAAAGEVGQLQANSQLLATISSQLNDLISITTTNSRLIASALSINQADEDMTKAQVESLDYFPNIDINSGTRYVIN